ncbi:hypothetical protein K2173_008617 [Erythroxylum novogranatense]|uniref:Uncharacterized protein n=1 Tax=Erythroxylum novogranatense TaxID=1862640 RepID=A0AAV8SKV1_9ROSI|nr:hypothetical protein K2173_008617 [Erythroxylum novogranatense]
MPSGVIAHHQPSSLLHSPIPISSPLSLAVKKSKMDGQDDMVLLGDPFEASLGVRTKDDGYESRSGSDNFEVASGDDQEGGEDQRRRKKKYHRHTQRQIHELEAFFKECPHPDEKQRSELSRRLGLEIKQIKFWFQNRRTQMKTQLERHENLILRQENDKLRAENEMLRQNMTDPICNSCGGSVVPGPVSYEQQHLTVENARLKDELNRVCALASKFVGRPLSSSPSPMPSFSPNSTMDSTLPTGLGYNDGAAMPFMKPMNGLMINEVPFDRSLFIDLAMVAMEELVKLAQIDSPLWIKSLDGGKETLNLEEYMRAFPSRGMKPSRFVSEASRETGIVIINSITLVEALMDSNRYVEIFPGLIAQASTIDILSIGFDGTKNGFLQLMQAEFQVVSPFVPVRHVRFLRFCKRHAEGVWAVVDVSIDGNQESNNGHASTTFRRLPSGCIIQDMANGCSKVTWMEHYEYDESAVHNLYRQVLSSGWGFGAPRWVSTLRRYCESIAILVTPTVSGEDQTGLSLNGKKSMLKLAQRMVDNFCSGVCASSVRRWDKLLVGNGSEDIRILTRKSMNDPGEPSGIVLSAATSVWLGVTRQRLFDFLRDERVRSDWDILSHGGLMQEFAHITKGQEQGNRVSLLRSNAATNGNAKQNNMLILQETWNDASNSLIVYAPVDAASMNVVMSGGDSNYVALLPSGFVIFPDDVGTSIKAGSLLTVGFQILVNSLPSAKITTDSVETVNNLIFCTIQRIKAALQLE